MSYLKLGRCIINKESVDEVAGSDSIALDCDGVLIDARNSYDKAILLSSELLLKMIIKERISLGRIIRYAIDKIRSTGGFNNDWDTTYAITIFSYLSRDSGRFLSSLEAMIDLFCKEKRLKGYESVNSFLREQGLLDKARSAIELLNYPGRPPRSLLASVFDEIYFGSRLYKKIYSSSPVYYSGEGLWKNEGLIVSQETFVKIRRIFGKKVALITGRPRITTIPMLGKLSRYVNMDASLFIGDVEINQELEEKLGKFRKPSELSLHHVAGILNSSLMIYAGNSEEDRVMAISARKNGLRVLFASVLPVSSKKSEAKEFFMRKKADIIAGSLGELVNLIEVVKDEKGVL